MVCDYNDYLEAYGWDRVSLCCVANYSGIPGNERTDVHARLSSRSIDDAVVDPKNLICYPHEVIGRMYTEMVVK